MNDCKRKCRRFFQDEGRACGILFGIVCFVVLIAGFLSPGRLGTVDTGKYETIMKEAGLEYTEEELQSGRSLTYDHVIEEFDYGHFSYAKLLAPSGVHSVTYPVALIRAVTQPFGISFSVKYLYLLYAVLASVSVYAITRGMLDLLGTPGVLIGAVQTLLMMDGNLNAYFASLYDTGTVVIGLLLTAASVIRAFSYGKGKGAKTMVPVVASGVFLLNASVISIVFLPFVFLASIIILKREWPFLFHRKIATFLLAGVLLTGGASNVRMMEQSPDIQSEASIYQRAFQGFLETSADPQRDLEYFGLTQDYADDIGKSYYMEEDAYQHDPKDQEEAKVLFAKINAKTVAKWYLQDPARILTVLLGQEENFSILESQRLLKVGQNNSQEDKTVRVWSAADTLLTLLLPTDYSWALFLLIVGGVLTGAAAFACRKREEKDLLIYAGIFWSWELGALGYVPIHLFFMGKEALELSRVTAVFAIVLISGSLLSFLGKCVAVSSVWFRKLQTERVETCAQAIPLEEEAVPGIMAGVFSYSFGMLKKWVRNIAADRKKTILAVSFTAVVMSGVILLGNPRAGSVNNGDFGRMMEQIGIIWQGDMYYNVDAQLGKRVIEEYAYREAFQPTALTFISPRYSLIFPASIVRGICSILNTPFSTYCLSIVMTVILVLCLILIIKDLSSCFGKWTLPLGLACCVIFLSESYLVWFNSLFGESCMFLGMFMVAACGIHLAVTPQGKGTIWVFLMLFASRFLVCAKAQMLVTLPILLLLSCVFAVYHRPLRLGKLIPYTLVIIVSLGIISYEGIKVYQDNGNISERQTIWQSAFYGALMISEDPEGDMEELGIDVRMAADIGKDAYQPDEDYVISPNSQEADSAFYDHVSTFDMVKYYLKRPVQFIKMLNHAAEESQELYNGFRTYIGQDYSKEHDTVDRWGLWLYWRPLFSFGSFWGYVLVYGILLSVCVFVMINSRFDMKKKLLAAVYLAVMLIGAVQYPLSVVGNGFADNQKQMFGFMLCHDMLTVVTCVMIAKTLWKYRKQINRKNIQDHWRRCVEKQKRKKSMA